MLSQMIKCLLPTGLLVWTTVYKKWVKIMFPTRGALDIALCPDYKWYDMDFVGFLFQQPFGNPYLPQPTGEGS